jgi:hypothetical protein
MAVEKISISLDSEVFEQAKQAADVEGIPLSAWLSRAASEAADLAAAQAALAEYIEVYGEPDQQAMAAARADRYAGSSPSPRRPLTMSGVSLPAAALPMSSTPP